MKTFVISSLCLLAALASIPAFSHRLSAHPQLTPEATTGTVKCTIEHAPAGQYVAYLFQTGAAHPYEQTSPFSIASYQAPTESFPNIPTGHRYFVRVVDTSCEVGGQSNDGLLSSGTLDVSPCNVSTSWSSGCPS